MERESDLMLTCELKGLKELEGEGGPTVLLEKCHPLVGWYYVMGSAPLLTICKWFILPIFHR